ncbi:MAG: RIP metalloprotease RseP [Hydrotalea flava]|uniref:RIP metalloprotease RseP n=1 Tax=Hydrotalea TaxID=1004300 RepID=UPI001696A893|nr:MULTISPECIES: RIP metalloprotease RseP [Hydrotalea]MBY0348655.1 RIP metalloprotease RseP [Hydrotalea flava]NIM34447.1 RIP metalloprotease RseP [Hydrotalea flava]NIM37278.1 RIP metalloprotease RseP [Hydrotalea flava]NIN02466.1 RIP metalloprotease RseP [Hydrotalea flava]NIN14123.1 RIP metalloprotease RseP [Hydrotalea flava]
MSLLVIDWSVVGIKAGQFILSFSILVILHELGHFLPARWFKCRVEKFFLFFNPWFSLWKKKIGETEYGIGWVPFGGYVKIAGMIDESMDKEQMKKPPEPYEFRAKPAWQRLIIMLGGVTVNILLAIVIFVGIMYTWGEKYIPAQNLKYGVYVDSLGKKIGMQDGDKIVAVAGKPVEKIGTVGSLIILNQATNITIERNGKDTILNVPPGFIEQLNKNKLGGFTYVRIPLIVDTVLPGTQINSDAAIHKGDRVIAINQIPVSYNNQAFDVLKDLKNKNSIQYTLIQNNTDTIQATVVNNTNPKIKSGIGFQTPDEVLGTVQIKYSFLQAIPVGIEKCYSTLINYISNLKLLFTSKEVKVNDSLGSVISIGGIFPGVWDWQSFWTLTAIFSIILAFMNVLPIPALDGGHALFTLVEMITGRKPGDKFMEYAQMVGMILLLSLMAYALGLDFLRIFSH